MCNRHKSVRPFYCCHYIMISTQIDKIRFFVTDLFVCCLRHSYSFGLCFMRPGHETVKDRSKLIEAWDQCKLISAYKKSYDPHGIMLGKKHWSHALYLTNKLMFHAHQKSKPLYLRHEKVLVSMHYAPIPCFDKFWPVPK